MKKLFYLGLVVLAFMSCRTDSAADYVFKGTVGPAYSGNTMVIYNQETELALDSAVIDSVGDIFITGKVDSVQLAMVKMNGRWVTNFVLSPDTLTLALRLGGVSGNSENDAWSTVTQKVDQKYRDFRKKAMDMQRNDPLDENLKPKLLTMINELSQYRLETFEAFYLENQDNLSGDLAFLALMKITTPEEFAPIYEKASQKTKDLLVVKRYMSSIKD